MSAERAGTRQKASPIPNRIYKKGGSTPWLYSRFQPFPKQLRYIWGCRISLAENVTVPFPDYIKNVASSEIYPTWPEAAIRANIYAQITYALNRIFNEFYRSQGYDFDITSTTQYDQTYIKGRDIYENISRIVDEIFNNYVVRQGRVDPFFTAYCNGTTTVCDGLSQWETVALAEQGLTPYQILQKFYGQDIGILENVPISANVPSYPGARVTAGGCRQYRKNNTIRAEPHCG